MPSMIKRGDGKSRLRNGVHQIAVSPGVLTDAMNEREHRTGFTCGQPRL